MKIAVIGGGFTGLTAAYTLAKAGHDVTIFEKEETLGGLAYGFKQPNWDWYLEGGYHHWFTNDDAILGLIDELGLRDKLIMKRPITANYYKGNIYQFDSPINLFTFPYLSPIDKLRTAGLLAFCKLNPFWKPLEAVPVKDFFVAFGGKKAWEVLWGPLMYGKFGTHGDSVPASWLWARVKKRTPRLMYMEGGFHTLVTALEEAILKYGGNIRTNSSIIRIIELSSQKKLSVIASDKTKTQFDRVLLTIPTPIAAKLVPGLSFQPIPHLHAQTLILETDKPILKDVYWLNIMDRTFPFLAAVAHTNFMDPKYYAGHHITYFGNYLPQGHPYLSMTKEQLLKEFDPFIKKLNPAYRLSLIAYRLFVGPFAQPVHQLHYSRLAPKFETPIPNVFLANLDSVYPWDRGTNYAVELGQKAGQKIMA